MRVSILTPKAFSIRRAMLPESAALPFRRLDKAPRNVQCGRGGGDAEACGLDDFRADEIAGVRRVLHGHGNCSFDPNNSLPSSNHRFRDPRCEFGTSDAGCG